MPDSRVTIDVLNALDSEPGESGSEDDSSEAGSEHVLKDESVKTEAKRGIISDPFLAAGVGPKSVAGPLLSSKPHSCHRSSFASYLFIVHLFIIRIILVHHLVPLMKSENLRTGRSQSPRRKGKGKGKTLAATTTKSAKAVTNKKEV